MSCDQGHQKICFGAMTLGLFYILIFLMSCDQDHQKNVLGALTIGLFNMSFQPFSSQSIRNGPF